MASYTTTSEVSAELGGVTIDASSTPSSATVDGWITDASAEIEQLSGQVWSSQTVASPDYEYADYQGNGRIILENAPIISVESVEYETKGLGGASTNWNTLTEGRTISEDFVLYKEEGLLQLHNSNSTPRPLRGKRNIRVRYTYGRSTTPAYIKRLCTLMVAKRYIFSVANKTGSTEGGSVSVGTISVDDPNNYVHNHLDRVVKEETYLREKIMGDFKPYIYQNNIYD